MKKMTKLFAAVAVTGLMTTAASAGALNGTKWQTIDDKTGEKKAVIQMTERGGKVSGKIIKIYNKADAKELCVKCPGSLKNKPVLGMTVLTGLKADGNNKWSGGKLVDPETGKTYKGKVTLLNNGKKLKLRGYIGVSALGRTQTWKRLN